jgi:hypothetical protein
VPVWWDAASTSCRRTVVGTCAALAIDPDSDEFALAVELGDTSEGVEGGAGPQRSALTGRSGFHRMFAFRSRLGGTCLFHYPIYLGRRETRSKLQSVVRSSAGCLLRDDGRERCRRGHGA